MILGVCILVMILGFPGFPSEPEENSRWALGLSLPGMNSVSFWRMGAARDWGVGLFAIDRRRTYLYPQFEQKPYPSYAGEEPFLQTDQGFFLLPRGEEYRSISASLTVRQYLRRAVGDIRPYAYARGGISQRNDRALRDDPPPDRGFNLGLGIGLRWMPFKQVGLTAATGLRYSRSGSNQQEYLSFFEHTILQESEYRTVHFGGTRIKAFFAF